jgi:hypothetical protein
MAIVSSDMDEPAHVHAKKNGKHAKFWLDPIVSLAFTKRLRRHELNESRKIVEQHREEFLEAWNDFFDNRP